MVQLILVNITLNASDAILIVIVCHFKKPNAFIKETKIPSAIFIKILIVPVIMARLKFLGVDEKN